MKEVDLNTVSQKKVISLSDQDFVAAYNPTTNELKIDPHSSISKNLLSRTVWNILNMLGAHEYWGHKMMRWNDETSTHFLAYLFQKRHRTWKKTTDFFKKYNEDNLNKFYLGAYPYHEENARAYKEIGKEYPSREHKNILENLSNLRSQNLYPKHHLSENDSIRFYDRIMNNFPDDLRKMKNPFKK
jgi:hypothetical protein